MDFHFSSGSDTILPRNAINAKSFLNCMSFPSIVPCQKLYVCKLNTIMEIGLIEMFLWKNTTYKIEIMG